MFQRILVGYVDADRDRGAMALGTILARATGAELIVSNASGEGEDLARQARNQEADLVVLGSTHRGPVGRLIPGATVERLLGDPPCAVAVAPPHFGDPSVSDEQGWVPLSGDSGDIGMRVIGVAYDGTRPALDALHAAVELAIPNGSALRVYCVAPKAPNLPGADHARSAGEVASETETLRAALHDAVASLPPEVRALPVFRRGFPADELIAETMIGVDLLVLGARRGGPIRRLLHQSVTSIVMQRGRCPVLILPAGVSAPTQACANAP